MNAKVAILIVSYNRKDFVLNNIINIKRSTYRNFSIILFDNGSNDGTIESVGSTHPDVAIIHSKENLGGAGGFAKAMEYAYTSNFEYIWCLDDDGFPKEDCLEILMEETSRHDKNTILGPKILPSNREVRQKHFWPYNGKYDPIRKKITELTADKKQKLVLEESSFETASVALLGMFMHRSVVERNGVPDSQLFISGDDVDYCLRAWTNGISVYLVQSAIVYHPIGKSIQVSIFGKKIEFLALTHWKLYYYIRNSIYTTILYFKFFQLIKTLLISFIIIFHHLIHEKEKIKIFKFGFLGVIHGLMKKKGKFEF